MSGAASVEGDCSPSYAQLSRTCAEPGAVEQLRPLLRPFLLRCLQQWGLESLSEASDGQGLVWADVLLGRVCGDLAGGVKFSSSLKIGGERAATATEEFLEARILLLACRFCSLPERRAVLTPERFAGLVERLQSRDQTEFILPGERVETLLVAAAHGGDKDRLSDLLAGTESALRGAIRGRYRLSADVVGDLIQDTHLRLLKAIYSFDASRSTFPAFAKRVAAFAVQDFFERQNRQQRFGQGLPNEWDAPGPAPMPAWPEDREVADPWPRNPDDDVMLREFFECAFAGGSPLHHKLALGFSVLHHEPPRTIVAELSDIPFKALTDRFWSDYPENGRASSWIRKSAALLEAHILLEDHIGRGNGLGHACFAHYYTGEKNSTSKAAQIARWTNEIRGRTIAEIAPRDPR